MRCKSCDTLLNEREVKKKEKSTGEFLDLCAYCYEASQEALNAAVDDSGIEYKYNLGGIET